MDEVKKLALPVDLIQSVINYLGGKPHQEVHLLISKIVAECSSQELKAEKAE